MNDGEYRRLNPRCKAAMYLGYAIGLAILASLILVIDYFDAAAEYTDIAVFAGWIAFAGLAIYCSVAPVIFYRRYRYILADDRVDVRRGIIITRHTLVPIERIHQVEVVSGPINKMFGLANVIITTAGGTSGIEFLEIAEADRVAEELNGYINRILKDRKKDD